MIDGLKPYPEFRKSGVPWAENLPTHWRTERAKWLFRKMDRPVRAEDEVVTCFRDGVVTLRKNRRLRGFTEAFFEFGYQGIRKGDLVIHAMDAFAGAVGVSDSDGKGTPVYSVCQPQPGVNPNFYALAIREMARSQWILALSRGIRERSTDFRFDTFGGQRVPLPPLDEQNQIGNFLDHASGRIERAIRAKKKLIALLNEQKQSIVHHAVTRGLNPNVALKPSGIPWLGDIPKHWEVRRNSRLFDERLEKGRAGLPLLVVSLRTGVTEGSEVDEDGRPKRLIADVTCYKFAAQGDLAYNMMRMWQGAVGLVPKDGLVSPAYVVAKPRAGVFSDYYELLFRTNGCKNEVNRNSRGIVSDRNRLYWDQFKRLYHPLPPIQEQRQIVSHIKSETNLLNVAISRTEREIGLLREYRTRLVADVVTGKLDVRAAAAKLPADLPVAEAITEIAAEDAEGPEAIGEDET